MNTTIRYYNYMEKYVRVKQDVYWGHNTCYIHVKSICHNRICRREVIWCSVLLGERLSMGQQDLWQDNAAQKI